MSSGFVWLLYNLLTTQAIVIMSSLMYFILLLSTLCTPAILVIQLFSNTCSMLLQFGQSYRLHAVRTRWHNTGIQDLFPSAFWKSLYPPIRPLIFSMHSLLLVFCVEHLPLRHHFPPKLVICCRHPLLLFYVNSTFTLPPLDCLAAYDLVWCCPVHPNNEQRWLLLLLRPDHHQIQLCLMVSTAVCWFMALPFLTDQSTTSRPFRAIIIIIIIIIILFYKA